MTTTGTSALFQALGWATTVSTLLLVGYGCTMALSWAAHREAKFNEQRLAPYLQAEKDFQNRIQREKEIEEYELQQRIEEYKNSPQYKGDHCYE